MTFKEIVKLLCTRYSINAIESTSMASTLKDELDLTYAESLKVFSSVESLSRHLDKIETL